MLNRFQKWADVYGRAFGFVVQPRGNWVVLYRDGEEIECMSVAGVQAACDNVGISATDKALLAVMG